MNDDSGSLNLKKPKVTNAQVTVAKYTWELSVSSVVEKQVEKHRFNIGPLTLTYASISHTWNSC